MPDSTPETEKISLQRLDDPIIAGSGVGVDVLRLDLIHPQLSGNKWFKLKRNLAYAKQQGYRGMLSFGGPWSNHIHALAWLGMKKNIPTIGLIRGEEPRRFTSDTLLDAENWGMELQFVSRTAYRLRNDSHWLSEMAQRYPDYHIVPEGGANALGVSGCREIADLIEARTNGAYDLVCCACGTGSTLAGIASALPVSKKILGIPVIKGGMGLANAIRRFTSPGGENWELYPDYHFGGYARVNSELARFITRFEQANAIPVEPVYTGKLFYGVYDLIRTGGIRRGSRLVVLHTGGIQGLRGMRQRMENLL
jgi:1-aminocyclopropane-1-carboxylate deaminase